MKFNLHLVNNFYIYIYINMKIRGKRILKNGATGAYVYYNKEKKWKWRIISGPKKGAGKLPNKTWGQSNEEYKKKINKFIKK